MRYLAEQSCLPTEQTPIITRTQLVEALAGGMAVLLAEGSGQALAFSTQDMPGRSVTNPSGEGNMRGPQDAFTEHLRNNISQLRRQFRTGSFTAEICTANTRAKTEYAICYDTALAPADVVQTLKQRLAGVQIPVLLDSTYFASFLKQDKLNLFPAAAYTERPATACARICEGKIVILVSGSPLAMVVPSFFAEHFECLDDYSSGAVFAGLIRLLKYLAFLLAVFGPGLYVMAVSFAPELIPVHLLAKLAQGEASTPLPPMPEMLAVTLLLEIVREAGLRAPKSISHTVSLVGALIIGETAVSAGIISVPVLTMAAAAPSAPGSPALYEQSILFRFAVILLAGLFGVPGLACGALLILAMACGSDRSVMIIFTRSCRRARQPCGMVLCGPSGPTWHKKGRCCRAMQKSNVDFYPVLLLSILADTLLRLHTGYWARAGLLALPASAAVLAAVLLLMSTSWQGNALLQKVLCVLLAISSALEILRLHALFGSVYPGTLGLAGTCFVVLAPVIYLRREPALRQTANALLVFGAACMAIMVLSVAPRLRVPNLHAAPLTGQDWQAAFVSQLALPPEYLLFALWPPQPGQRCRKAVTFAASALGFDAAVHLLLELFFGAAMPTRQTPVQGAAQCGALSIFNRLEWLQILLWCMAVTVRLALYLYAMVELWGGRAGAGSAAAGLDRYPLYFGGMALLCAVLRTVPLEQAFYWRSAVCWGFAAVVMVTGGCQWLVSCIKHPA